MDINSLVSWSSPSTAESLSLELVSLPFPLNNCTSSSTKTILLSNSSEVYILGPELQKIQTTHPISEIACNDNIVLLLSVSGLTLVFGNDIHRSGILGIDTTAEIHHPAIIPALKEVKAVGCSLGRCHAAVIDAEGKLYTWGSSKYRQLGKSETTPSIVDSTSIFCITKVQCGAFCTIFSTSGGYLYTFGKIGRSSSCSEPLRKVNEPYTIAQMENHFTADFAVGENFVAALTSEGEVYVYDDCRVLMKVPSAIEVTGIRCCKSSIYCIEHEICNVNEWRLADRKNEEGCNLKALTRNNYKLSAEKLFNSSGETMYAVVRKETLGKVIVRNTHELSVAIPSKTIEGSLSLSPGIQRTPFSQLSKEFSLNIENSGLGKYDSLERIVHILTGYLQVNFTLVREKSLMSHVYNSTVKRHSITNVLVDTLQKMASINAKYSFDRIYMNSKNTYSGISIEQLNAAAEKTERFYKKHCFFLIKGYIKHRAYNYKLRYAMLIFASSVECIFHKQKSLIFSLLLRSVLNKAASETPLSSLCNLLHLRLSQILSLLNPSHGRSPSKMSSLIQFALSFQTISEKRRYQSLLRGFNCFSRLILRTHSCYTPSLFSIRTEKTFADFDQNLNFNLNDSYSREFIDSTSASPPDKSKFLIAVPQKHAASTSLKEEKMKKVLMGASTERRNSTATTTNTTFVCKARTDPKKANEARKAYDLKLKQKRSMVMQGKRNSREIEAFNYRNKRIVQAILIAESKFVGIVRRQKTEAVWRLARVFPIRNVQIQVWKTKIYALGLHKFSMVFKKYIKGIMLLFSNNIIIND